MSYKTHLRISLVIFLALLICLPTLLPRASANKKPSRTNTATRTQELAQMQNQIETVEGEINATPQQPIAAKGIRISVAHPASSATNEDKLTTQSTTAIQIGVGEVLPAYYYIVGAPPYTNTTLNIKTSFPGDLVYAPTASGSFANSITLSVQTDGNGNGVTSTFYRKGLIYGLGSEIASGPALLTVSNAFTVYGVGSLTFYTFGDNYPLDNNPNSGDGLRIFPDKKTPNDPAASDRKIVKVSARIVPYEPGIQISIKGFDIDDPSGYSAIDANGSLGYDNRGYSSTVNSTVTGVSDSLGYVHTYINAPLQPGDNLMMAATCGMDYNQNIAYLSGLNGNGPFVADSIGYLDTSLHGHRGLRSKMLTTWRRLHIERDSMGLVSGNYVKGTITDVESLPTFGFMPPQTKITLNRGLPEINRFENGALVVDTSTGETRYPVVSSGLNDVIVEVSLLSRLSIGATFKLYDDDDMNLDDGLISAPLNDGDNGEDVPMPYIPYLLDSDNLIHNRLASAYVRPIYDLPSDDNVPFKLNLVDDTSASQVAIYKFDNIATEEDPLFWTIYMLGAYQGAQASDGDPEDETDVEVAASDGFNIGCVYFNETDTDSQIEDGVYYPPTDSCSPAAIMLHEVGHLFGAAHSDGGVMARGCDDATSYSTMTIARIRGTLAP